MFKNKYLKRLKDVQDSIRNCKANIAASKPPFPCTCKVEADMLRWLQMLTYGNDPHIDDLVKSCGFEFKDETLDYLHKLGEYFINVADCSKAEKKYEAELIHLQAAERLLKEKLGID